MGASHDQQAWFEGLIFRYSDYYNDLATFRTKLLSALDTTTRARLDRGNVGLRGQSLGAIWIILLTEFNELSSTEVDQLKAQLNVPYLQNQSLTNF